MVGVANFLHSEDLPMAVEPEKGVEPFICGPSHAVAKVAFSMVRVVNFVTI